MSVNVGQQLDYPHTKTGNKEKGPAVASVIKSSFNMLYLTISNLFNTTDSWLSCFMKSLQDCFQLLDSIRLFCSLCAKFGN